MWGGDPINRDEAQETKERWDFRLIPAADRQEAEGLGEERVGVGAGQGLGKEALGREALGWKQRHDHTRETRRHCAGQRGRQRASFIGINLQPIVSWE